MKKELFLFSLLAFVLTGLSQDLIVTAEGDSINCKINKIEAEHIYFSYLHDGEIRNTLLSVSEIKVYEQDFYETPAIPENNNKANFPRIRIAGQGGYSYRIAKLPEGMSALWNDYMKKLKSGYHLGADINYFISKQYGIGLKYSYFNSKNHLDDVYIEYDDGTTDFGVVEDKIAINFFGPSFSSRSLSRDNKSAFITTIAFGYLSYKDDAIFIHENLQISGSTFGMAFDLGYDFGIADDMAIGLQLSFTLGTLSKLEVNRNGQIETIELDSENYENLSRLDLSIGLRFNK